MAHGDTQVISPQVMMRRSSLHMRHDMESRDQCGEDYKAGLDGPVAMVKGMSRL